MKNQFSPKKIARPLLILTLLATACGAIAGDNSPQEKKEASQDIGSVESVISAFTEQHKNRGARVAHSINGKSISNNISHFHNKDDVISISGFSTDSPNSTFFLKGNKKSLRGYIVHYDTKTAYEYSTNKAGRVILTEVPITKAVPDLNPDWNPDRSYAPAAGNDPSITLPTESPMAKRQAPFIGPYMNEDVTKLESRPGSPYVMFLDIRPIMDGTIPKNRVTKAQMFRMWQVVTGFYSTFNLNITTNPAVYNAAKAADITRTGIALFINGDGSSNAEEMAFGTEINAKIYATPEHGYGFSLSNGLTTGHEIGHLLGMHHDGKLGQTVPEYFVGLPEFQWGPIMGNYWRGSTWAQPLWTWSKGEYTGAMMPSTFPAEQQDDLSIINTVERVPYMLDDNPLGKAMVVNSDGTVSPTANFGLIERTGDTDIFTFTAGARGRTLNLDVDRIEYLGMLDVNAKLLNSAGAEVASSNLQVNRNAKFSNLFLPEGSYSLVISGGAEGTPSNGFSNYSSLGYYAMNGSLKPTISLTSGIVVTGIGLPLNGQLLYSIVVPAGKTSLTFKLSGGTGDIDMYEKLGSAPTLGATPPDTAIADQKSHGGTNTEAFTISAPPAGTYYLLLHGSVISSGASLIATVN